MCVKCAFYRRIMQLAIAWMHLTLEPVAFFFLFAKMQLKQIKNTGKKGEEKNEQYRNQQSDKKVR